MSDGENFVYSFAKNDREEIRASLSEWKDSTYAHIRIYVENAAGEVVATPKGVSVLLADLPKLQAAVNALVEAAG